MVTLFREVGAVVARWILILALTFLLVPTSSSASLINILSVQQSSVGNAQITFSTYDDQFFVNIMLPTGDVFSSAQVIVDFPVSGSPMGMSTVWPYGSSPPQSYTAALVRLTPDQAVLMDHSTIGSVDEWEVVPAEEGAVYRHILSISQLGGEYGYSTSSGMTAFVPEPTSALLFLAGLMLVRRRFRSV